LMLRNVIRRIEFIKQTPIVIPVAARIVPFCMVVISADFFSKNL